MAYVEWDDSYSVKVAEIDAQHRKLFVMINRFYEDMTVDKRKAQDQLLGALLDYVKYHFSTEERYFDQFGYPNAAAHKAKHREFGEKFASIRKRMDAGELVVSLEITRYLRDWLVSHIQGVDKEYGPFFNAHGLR